MVKIQTWIFVSILSAVMILTILRGPVLAVPTSNVGLTRFEAIPLDDAVRLEWDTETELETAGFMLKRGQNGSFAYLADPDGSGSLFILSEGGPAFGSSYDFTDDTAINSESYTYQLVEVEIGGSEVTRAESTVTVGIVPTNTPIVLGADKNAGANNNPAVVTETATVEATVFASPTPQNANNVIPPAASEPTTAATIFATSTPETMVESETSSQIVTEEQLGSDQPAVSEFQEIEDQDNALVAVAHAQEDPQAYPGDQELEVTPEDFGEGAGGAAPDVDGLQESAESGANQEPPDVIGATPYLLEPTPTLLSPPLTESFDTNDTTSSDSLAGKIYLWVAFIAALVIFTAAVLGAILLYTRQRSKE